MKKILSLTLVLMLAFIVSACEKKSSEFEKPKNYSSILIVSINPEFKLYLDENNTVLAVEPVNEDAKEIQENIKFENENVEKVVEKIVTTANEKGFIKKDTVINLVVEEVKEKDDAEELLNKTTNAVKDTSTKLKIDVSVKQENNIKEENKDNTNNQNTPSTDNNKEEQNTHTHEFSEATCTKPATCSCGETQGTALGHNYKNGKCTRCGAKDPNFSYTAVNKKNGYWTFAFATAESYYNVTLKLYNNENTVSYRMGMSYDVAYADDPEIKEKLINECSQMSECVKFKNKYYWVAAGGGDELSSVVENKTTVTITDIEGNKLVLSRTSEKKLKVKSSPASFCGLGKIPVGTVITFG